MKKFTSKDIEAIREYLKKLEDLDKKTPSETVTKEEWEDFFKILDETGEFPSKYKGRIAKKQELTYTVPVNGKPTPCPEGKDRTIYYDIAFEDVNNRFYDLQRQYKDAILKVLGEGEAEGAKTLIEMLEAAVDTQPDVLDVSNLPNLLVTDKRLQYAISPLRNEYAYIMPFDYEQLSFDYDDNGEIVIKSQEQYNAVEEAKDASQKIEAAGIDQPLLRQLFAATMKAYLCNYGNSITVYLPSFAREMRIDVYYSNLKAEAESKGKKAKIPKHNSNDFFKKLAAIEKLNGVWQGGSFYRVFVLEGYDAEQNTLTFSSPWFFKLARELVTTPAKKQTRADGSIIWAMPGVSGLVKASIVSARSKPTAEIIAQLITSLQQYGTKPEARRNPGRKYADKELVEYKISFKTLIERIPLIMQNLEDCKPSNKTTLLQRYFCGNNFKERLKEKKGYILEEYINEYTVLKDYYKDFEIKFNPPTIKTLSDKIVIRHKGINGNYDQSASISDFQFQEANNNEV